MAYKEESLEDKIAAIMAGNYSFGPPIKLPVPRIPLSEPGPVASSLGLATGASAQTPTLSSAPSWSVPSSSAKTIPDEGTSGRSTRLSSGATSPTVAEQTSSKKEHDSEGHDLSDSPHDEQEHAHVSPLPSLQSAYVGFGDVYEDASERIDYNESDLHVDAVSDGFLGLSPQNSATSVKFADVYGEPAVAGYDRNPGVDALEDGESSVTSPVPEEEEEEVRSANEGDFTAHVPARAAKDPSPVQTEAPQRTPVTPGAVDSEAGKVQPQLNFIPLSARSSSRETLALEGNGLVLNTDEATLNSRQSTRRAGWESPKESPLRLPVTRPSVAAAAAAVATTATAGPPRSLSPTDPPVVSSAAPVYEQAGMGHDTMVGADQQATSSGDAVHDSLLFGDSTHLDESGDFGRGEGVQDGEGLSFAPDGDATVEDVNMDDDSLNGADRDHTTGDQGISEDLMQTVRVTQAAPAAVRDAPVATAAAAVIAAPAAISGAAPLPSAKESAATKIESATEPLAEKSSAGKAPFDTGAATVETVDAVPPAAAAGPVLPQKPRPTSASAAAREKAAFLLPTITEEKPPVSRPAAPSHSTSTKAALTQLPVKVAAESVDSHQAHFLARISAATSVPIQAPPVPERATPPTSVPKPAAPVRERSTTPTSIPKPTSSHSSRPTTPLATSRPSSAGSTASGSVRGREKGVASSAAPAKEEVAAKPAKSGVKARVSAIERAESAKQASSPPAPLLAKKGSTVGPSSGKKAPAVQMSATSADEIALLGAAKASTAPTAVKKKSSGVLSPSRALAAVAEAGVAEVTLLSSPEAPPRHQQARRKATQPPKDGTEEEEAVTPGGSSRKSKGEAWVIDTGKGKSKGGSQEQKSPVPTPASAAAASTTAAAPSGPVAMTMPESAKKSVKAAAWVIENGPEEQQSKLRFQETAQQKKAVGHTTVYTSTAPVNASASVSAALLFGTGEDTPDITAPTTPDKSHSARARAVSPNTTARLVSRVSHNHAPLSALASTPMHTSDDNPHPERAVKVAVRVRPFTVAEVQQGHKRTLTMNAGQIIVVNPKSFAEDPDDVAAVAISTDNRQWAHLFDFDNVLWDFDAQAKRETVVDQVELHRHLGLEIVENALQGISSSCFAYGHTCTGKTYSLFGPSMIDPEHVAVAGRSASKVPLSLARFSLGPESGLIQRVFHDVIHLSHKGTRMFVTFMEIYNEKIRDLLVDQPLGAHSSSHSASDTHSQHSRHSNGSASGRKLHGPTHIAPAADTLKLREHPTFGPYVENLVKVEVFSVDDALRLIAKGQAARSSTQTVWNANSSRSHAVVTLELSPTEIDPSKQYTDPRAKEFYERSHSPHMSPSKNTPDRNGNSSPETAADSLRDYEAPLLEQVVRIQMVDLAGSEKDTMRDEDEHGVWAGARFDGAHNKTQEGLAEKERNELRLIRRSLSTLGYIIKALTKGASMRSLPYRDCTLTFLLKDALCGRNHTTMLATVSPSHTCYEETLSTLRYAERLCEVHNSRRLGLGHGIPSADGSGLTMTSRLVPSTIPRKVILDEFRRVHQGLVRGSAAHSEKSRDFIRRMLLDKAPRPSRLAAQFHAASASGQAGESSSAADSASLAAFSKPLDSLTEADLQEAKNAYQKLASQAETAHSAVHTLRSDRDTLVSELRSATNMLNEYETAKAESRAQVASLTKYLRAAEKELSVLQGKLRRREEEADKLKADLDEERRARSSAEQLHQTRTKEFLARFDALKKENKVLTESLNTVSDKHKSTADDKKDQAGQIERLRQQLKVATAQRDSATAEVEQLRAEQAEATRRLDAEHGRVGQLQGVEQHASALTLQAEKLKADLSILSAERDSLAALLAQKDSQLQVQSQQAERSLRTLQLKVTSLERSLAFSAVSTDAAPPVAQSTRASDAECAQLRDRLAALFSSEGQLLSSETQDSRKLTALVRDLGAKLLEVEDLEAELARERQAREAAQRQLSEQAVSSQVSQMGRSALDHQVSVLQLELLKLQEAHRKLEHDGAARVSVLEGAKASLEEQVGTLQKELLVTKDALALSQERLTQQTNLAVRATVSSADLLKAQAEAAALKDQLVLCQRDAFAAKEELRAAQEAMQAEYTAMWNSVQELSKLDALKDQSIQDLIADRDKAVLERDSAFERFAAVKAENALLAQEIQDIDVELLRAVEAGEYRLSPRGQHKSIMIQNVSDRTMFGLARRQQQQKTHLQAQHHQHHHAGSPYVTGAYGLGDVTTPPAPHSAAGMATQAQGGFMSPPAAYHNTPTPSQSLTPVLNFSSASHHSGHDAKQHQQPQQSQPQVFQQELFRSSSSWDTPAMRQSSAGVESNQAPPSTQRQQQQPLPRGVSAPVLNIHQQEQWRQHQHQQAATEAATHPHQATQPPQQARLHSGSQGGIASLPPAPHQPGPAPSPRSANGVAHPLADPYRGHGSSHSLDGPRGSSAVIGEGKLGSDAVSEEEKLERELQELSYLEGSLRQKVQHTRSASTLSTTPGSFYATGAGSSSNYMTSNGAGAARRKA